MNKITLGIPTLNRFDSFLKNNLEKYLQNKLIDEIVIVDENGQDYEKINYYFDHEKIKVFKNEKILGPFLNKLEVLKKSKNDWVALIDSDNFAEENYFKTSISLIKDFNFNTIICPSFAKPDYDLTFMSNLFFGEKNLYEFDFNNLAFFMNVGNYVINRKIIENIDFNGDLELILNSPCCDVKLFNTILMENTEVQFFCSSELNYNHVRHDGSIYLQTISDKIEYCKIVYDRFKNLYNNSKL
jgi:hypothetical protein